MTPYSARREIQASPTINKGDYITISQPVDRLLNSRFDGTYNELCGTRGGARIQCSRRMRCIHVFDYSMSIFKTTINELKAETTPRVQGCYDRLLFKHPTPQKGNAICNVGRARATIGIVQHAACTTCTIDVVLIKRQTMKWTKRQKIEAVGVGKSLARVAG